MSEKALKLINGIPRMRTIIASAGAVYDETYVIPNGGLSSGTNVGLPLGGLYTDKDLKVFLNGQYLEVDLDYEYVGSDPRSEIKILVDLNEGDRLRFRAIEVSAEIYDKIVVAPNDGYPSSTNISLPDDQTYVGSELEVYLNGQFMEPNIDYSYVGATAPRTQISLVFDILKGERLRFRIDP